MFLLLNPEQKAIIYIGSHNWTRRALGPVAPRNAEASLRVETPFNPEDLDGKGTSLASDVNRHLLQAYNLPACLPATETHRTTFEQWFQKGCRRAPGTRLDEVTMVLAVHQANGSRVTPDNWQSLPATGSTFKSLGRRTDSVE